MAKSFSSPIPFDKATVANNALLLECQHPANVAKNRAICRANGVPDGAHELRRVQHFVSQAVIKLLARYNITQKDGRPYVASCPKGFLQGPNVWLVDKGFYLSGWPDGLPNGSISIWPAYYTFALAAMFINDTISLKPLSHALVMRKKGPAHAEETKASQGKKPEVNMERSLRANNASALASMESEISDSDKPDSDLDAEGSTESVSATGSTSASASKCFQKKHGDTTFTLSTLNDTLVHSGQGKQNALSSVTAAAPSAKHLLSSVSSNSEVVFGAFGPRAPLPPRRLNSDTKAITKSSADTDSSLFPLPTDTVIDLSDPRALEELAAALSSGSAIGKRRTPSDPAYPGVPTGATIDWVPPISAARETKKARRV